MTEITLSLMELGAVVAMAVGLAATDAAAVSRLAVSFAAKKLGVSPGEIYAYDQATGGEGADGKTE